MAPLIDNSGRFQHNRTDSRDDLSGIVGSEIMFMTGSVDSIRPFSPLRRDNLYKHLQAYQNQFPDFRFFSPLPSTPDPQQIVDDVILDVGHKGLQLVAAFISAGLVVPLPNWLSVMELKYRKRSATGHARRTMTPGARGENARPSYTDAVIPVYCTIEDFEIGIRELLAHERNGVPLDTNLIAEATRNVNEAIEDAAINGAGLVVDTYTTPGIFSAPNVNTVTYSGSNPAWDHASKTGAEILTDVRAMALQNINDTFSGPFDLMVTTAYNNALNKPYSDGVTTFDRSVRSMIEEMTYGGRPIQVVTVDNFPANRTALIQMDTRCVDVIMGQQPTSVSWSAGPGWSTNHAVLACVVPRYKSTSSGQSGICVGNTTA